MSWAGLLKFFFLSKMRKFSNEPHGFEAGGEKMQIPVLIEPVAGNGF